MVTFANENLGRRGSVLRRCSFGLVYDFRDDGR
jgi:hypothetical protein